MFLPFKSTKAMISAEYLLKLWPGLPEHILYQYLTDMPDQETSREDDFKFPQAYWLQRTIQNPDNGELTTEYVHWGLEKPRFLNDRKYRQGGRPSVLDEILFLLSDIIAYEDEDPTVKYDIVDPDKAWKERLNLTDDKSLIVDLRQQLKEAQEETKKQRQLTNKFKNELEGIKENEIPTTVNSKLWEASVNTALALIVEILLGDKKDWKKCEFTERLRSGGGGSHSKVEKAAWKAVPEEFKWGPGRPKNAENPNQ